LGSRRAEGMRGARSRRMGQRDDRIHRRTFLSVSGAALTLLGGASSEGHAADPPQPTLPVPQRLLGKTGQTVSMIGIGGFHLGQAESEQESVRIVHQAIDRGVTFLDNCWDYNGGRSEEVMGKALADGRRQKAFLMTKLDGRTKKAATEQLEQ